MRPGQTAQRLAQRFNCSARTIERDIHERLPGIGVVAVNQRGYRFLHKPHLRALALTREELVGIILAHKVAEPSLDSETRAALSRVLDKIRSGLPSWEKNIAELLELRTSASESLETKSDTSQTLFSSLTESVTEQRRVKFLYRGRKDEADKVRQVEPLGLFFQDKRWYLQAFDLDREGLRTFRLARMADLEVSEERFEPKMSFTQESAAFHRYDIADSEPVTLKLSLQPSLARWFEENKPHPSVSVDGTQATVTVSDPEAFLRWFASLDGAQVVAPPKYCDWFAGRLRRIAQLY